MPNKDTSKKVRRNQNPSGSQPQTAKNTTLPAREHATILEALHNATREIASLKRQLSDLQSEFIGKQMEVGEVRYEEKVHWAKVAARAMLRLNQYKGDFQPISTAKAILGEAFLDAFPEIGNTGDPALVSFLGEKFEMPEVREFIVREVVEYSVNAKNAEEACDELVRCGVDAFPCLGVRERDAFPAKEGE